MCMQLNDAIEGQQSGTSIPLRVYGARGGGNNTWQFFKEPLYTPCIFCLKVAKGLEFSRWFHFQGLEQHRVFIYFDWFPNSPELGNPSKNPLMLAKLFSARILNQNEPIEKQAWWGEMANCFLEQNRFVMKKRAKNQFCRSVCGWFSF